jgi:RimJ/RimL family protein N-acetyltransferase
VRLLFGQDAAVAQWVGERIPHVGSGAAFGPSVAIGIVREDGFPVGGVVYHNHYPAFGNIEMSIAADTPKWLTKPIVCALLRYPFSQLGCIRITACTPRRAASVRRFLDKFGFKREGLIRRAFGTDDAVVSGLLRSEWDPDTWRPRRLPPGAYARAHGQASAVTSASA